MKLDPSQRDPVYIRDQLMVGEDRSLTTRVACQIQLPERYLDRHLASIGADTYILGVFAIIMGDRYAVSLTNAMMRIDPSSTETMEIDGDRYLLFNFDAGDRVVSSIDLVKKGIITYYIYDEFIAKGRIPWYMDYHDFGLIFESAKRHAGVNLGNRAVLELIISTINRQPDDLSTLYRHYIKTQKDIEKTPPAVIPFRSVIYNASDTTSKLIGSYFSESLTSALVNPSDRVERIEELLRT